MSMKSKKRVSLLRFWTSRYVLTLCLGLIVVGIISTYWIKYNMIEKRIDIIRLMAEEIADHSVDAYGNLIVNPNLAHTLDRRQRFMRMDPRLSLFIVDRKQHTIFSSKPSPFMPEVMQAIASIEDNQKDVVKMVLKQAGKFYLVKREIKFNKEIIGWVMMVHPDIELRKNKEDIQILLIMLGSLALLGWIVIYLLTRKLSKPIQDVADAAKQIVSGNYEVKLAKDHIKEQELYELVESFKDMTQRLKTLEALRTELLAGVTHELKTPVTAISGLIQAVKDDVVENEEAKEFLEISAKETEKLHKMIEDLLNFNSFTVGDITVHKEPHELNTLVQEISHQWLTIQEENTIQLEVELLEQSITISTDPLRIQQILYNLLNNAKQGCPQNAQINITLSEVEDEVRVDVSDNGEGIPSEEQELIFERFYRGTHKKYQMRGLGIGLPFSRMMARALGGDIVLKQSSELGTTFTLILKK